MSDERTLAKDIVPAAYMAGILVAIALAAAIFTKTGIAAMASLILAVFFYMFLPGFLVLLNLALSPLERSILAFPVSVALVGLAVYFLNVFGMPLSTSGTIIAMAIISAAGLCPRLIRK